MNVWTEHRNPEGRTYWFNTGTKQSVWEKPDELKTAFERALNQTKWKEYFSGGRKYYYNTETKESKWDMPDELLLVLEKVEKDGPGPAAAAAAPTPQRAITAPGFTPVGSAVPDPSASAAQQPPQNGVGAPSLAVGAHTGGVAALPLAANSVLPPRPNLPDDPVIPHNGFQTVEEGEKAFTHLLRKAGVDAGWTWDQTMRAIITDPLYKALNTLAEKKSCWERYTTGLRQKESEERETRLSKLRPALRNMLRGNPNVFHYTTFRTADKLFAQHPIWQQARIEAERKLIFEEYVSELKDREVSDTRAARSRSVAKVVALFKDLNVDVVTRWRQAYDLLVQSDEWRSDGELRNLPSLDILLAFEDYSRVREREYEEQTRRAQVEKTRKERKAREGFKSLLNELVQSNAIKARTKWKEVYPLFRDDARYLDILGNPGSNPLELFWDAVDVLDQKLDAKIGVVEDAIRRLNANRSEPGVKAGDGEDEKEKEDKMDVVVEQPPFVVLPEMTWEQFVGVVNPDVDASLKVLTEDELRLVFKTLHDAALKKQSDEKRRAERKQRHLQDDLRYAMKKLSEPLDISLKYEDIVPMIENLPEYKALEDEEGRKAAFAKYVKRQKERMRETGSEDGGSATSRKRKEPVREHREDDREKDRERDRDRGDRERERDRDRGDKDKREKDSHRDRERDRDRDRGDRGKDYERSSRSSRHHHTSSRYDEKDVDGGRDKEREKDRGDREYRSSKYHRDEKEDTRKRERDAGGSGKDRDRDRGERASRATSRPVEVEKEKRDEDRSVSDRAEKRARYDKDEDRMDVDSGSKRRGSTREETPEEGEI